MKKLYRNQAVRYIFFGGCSTLVNLGMYYILRQIVGMDITAANTAAIFTAILFAYVVNKNFVFEHRTESFRELLKEAGGFIGMRLGTMLVEILGVLLLSIIWGMNDMIAKILIQVVILVLNFLISKYVVFKKEDAPADAESLEKKRRGRLFFLAGFLLSALAAGIGFAVIGVWPFGDKTLLIIDSLHQYLPFYTDFHEKLAGSESLLYSISGGFGYNFWSTYAYYMASPLNFLMVFVPTENVCDFMDLMILLKIALCGGFFSWYLHDRDPKRKYLPAAFGVMFALSNFILGYYFNLMWLDSIAVLPLVMKGIERIVRQESGKLYGLALFYGLWCNYYIGFMLCIFSCLYFLVRWISAERIRLKAVGKSCLTFGWYSLLAGGMAALVLLPAFLGLSSSESMQGNTFPTLIRFYTSFAEMMLSHFAFTDPVNISNSQVGLNVYCTVAAVLLAVLYLFDRKIRLRERLGHYALCALLLLSFSFNILNYIWHGFHVQNGLPNRFAFLYIALLLVMAYDVLGHLQSIPLPFLLAAWAIPAAFVGWCFVEQFGELEEYIYLITLGLLILYLGLLMAGKYLHDRGWRLWCGVLSLVLIGETAANGIHGIISNGGVTRSIYLADQESYQNLMAVQGDTDFYRSEVDRQRMRNVTMFCGGNSIVMFNSTMQESVIRLCQSLGIEARTNKNGYLGVTKLFNDVFGIKYLASPVNQAETMYQFEKVDQDGELTLYKNDNALSIGFMVQDSIRDWDIQAAEPLQVQNSFVELATGLEPIFVLDRYIDMEDGQNYGIKIPENKQVYLCIDTRVASIDLNTPEYSRTYTTYTDNLYVINGTEESNMADFTVELNDNQTTVQAQVYTCSNEAYQEVIDKLSESQMTDVSVDGNKISGRVDVKEAGTLLLTIPYDEGWQITVDGAPAEFYTVGDTFIGLHLEEGEHEIRMTYTPGGLWEGSAVSLVCVLLFFLTGIWEKRHPAWFAGKRLSEEEAGKENQENLPEESAGSKLPETMAGEEKDGRKENQWKYEGDRENEHSVFRESRQNSGGDLRPFK